MMDIVDETDLDASQTEKEKDPNDWSSALPSNAGEVRDISLQGFWTLSSYGFGVHQLLEDSIDQYWQSDGPQPHTVTVEFSSKTDISFLLLYLDYKTDESYTPSKFEFSEHFYRVTVYLGSSILDLDDGLTVMFTEPLGWQVVDLRHSRCRSEKRPARASVLQLQVTQNHQNGRDTHIRQMKILGPARTQLDTDAKALVAAGAAFSNMPLKFTSPKMASYMSFR
uniref:Anaphase-promoting complex subunit 10 n=1 Tax=Syphacia muris TaxID=451379 RepID=A0A0N5AET3_9BILA